MAGTDHEGDGGWPGPDHWTNEARKRDRDNPVQKNQEVLSAE